MLVVLLLWFAAAAAGFVVGRETAEDDGPSAAETTSEATTTAEATTESQPTTTAETATAATTTETEGEEADGAAVFAEAGCGGCHTFGPANSAGTAGPPLDDIGLNKDEIAQQVRNGGGGMPAFGDRLSDAEIEAVADYVESG